MIKVQITKLLPVSYDVFVLARTETGQLNVSYVQGLEVRIEQ